MTNPAVDPLVLLDSSPDFSTFSSSTFSSSAFGSASFNSASLGSSLGSSFPSSLPLKRHCTLCSAARLITVTLLASSAWLVSSASPGFAATSALPVSINVPNNSAAAGVPSSLSLFDTLGLAVQGNAQRLDSDPDASTNAAANADTNTDTNADTSADNDPEQTLRNRAAVAANDPNLEVDTGTLDRRLLTQKTPAPEAALRQLADQAQRNAQRANNLFALNELKKDAAFAYIDLWTVRAQTEAIERFREGLSRQFTKTPTDKSSGTRSMAALNDHILRELGLKREALIDAQKTAEQRLFQLIGSSANRPLEGLQITRNLALTEAELERQLPRHPAIIMADQHRVAIEALARLQSPQALASTAPGTGLNNADTAMRGDGPASLSLSVPVSPDAYDQEYRRLGGSAVKQAYAEFVNTYQTVRRGLVDAMQNWRKSSLALDALQRSAANTSLDNVPLSQKSATVLRNMARGTESDWLEQLRNALQAEMQEITLKQTVATSWVDIALSFSQTDLLRRSLLGERQLGSAPDNSRRRDKSPGRKSSAKPSSTAVILKPQSVQ